MIKEYDSNVWPPYWGFDVREGRVEVVKTAGSFLYTKDGDKVFDGIASWWSVCHGYNNKRIISAMQNCLSAMPHVMFGGITHRYAENLASMLCDFLGKDFQKVFFCDSGSVATEVAVKMALQYWQALGQDERKNIVAFAGCYHGDTFMAGGVSSDDDSSFGDCINNVIKVNLPKNNEDCADFEKFIEKNYKNIACFIIEPLVQGAAGIKFYSKEILHKLYNIAKKYGVIFIQDECAMGFYRTGKKFAFNHCDITPDIVTLGKALSGGHAPLACVCTNNVIFKTISQHGRFKHGPTFMGNPLVCSAGIASVEIFNDFNYKHAVGEMEGVFKNLAVRLKKKYNLQARVMGGILAVDISESASNVRLYIYNNIYKLKLWVRPIGNTLYLMPPLNSNLDDLQVALISFEEVVKTFK